MRTTKKIVHECVVCARAKPPDYQYYIGDLPQNRIQSTRPFQNVGADYAGPFFVKEKKLRNRGKVKVWVSIFVCLATKATHMELVSELTTAAFLAALRRFFARRGECTNIYSDNATNYVGAKNELDTLFGLLNSKEHNACVSSKLAERGIK